MAGMSEVAQCWRIHFQSGKPMHLEQVDPAEAPPQGDPPQGHGGQMRATLSSYVDAVQDLLRGKYAAVKQMLPPYLADPGNFVAFGCDDGIIVRIDPNT